MVGPPGGDGVSGGCGGARLLPSADTKRPAEWFQRPLVKSPRARRIKARSRFQESVPRMTENPREDAASRRIRGGAVNHHPGADASLGDPRPDLDGGPR